MGAVASSLSAAFVFPAAPASAAPSHCPSVCTIAPAVSRPASVEIMPLGKAGCLRRLALGVGEIMPRGAVPRPASRHHHCCATPAAKSAMVCGRAPLLLRMAAQAALLEGRPREAKPVAAPLSTTRGGQWGSVVLVAFVALGCGSRSWGGSSRALRGCAAGSLCGWGWFLGGRGLPGNHAAHYFAE